MGAHPLGEDLRGDPTGVVVAGQEPGHPGGPRSARRWPGSGSPARTERDLAIHRGEQSHRCGVVGLQDHPQLGLDRLLGLQQPVPVPGQGLDLGQQRGRHRERPPVPVFVAQRVGEHERVEPVVLDRGDPVALRARAAIRGETGNTGWPRACRCSTSSPRSVPSRPGLLTVKRCELRHQVGQAGHVVGDPQLSSAAGRCCRRRTTDDARHPSRSRRTPATVRALSPESSFEVGPLRGRPLRTLIQVLEARLPLAGRGPPPPGGTGLPLDLPGHAAKVLSRRRRWTSGTIPPPMMLTDDRCQAAPSRISRSLGAAPRGHRR